MAADLLLEKRKIVIVGKNRRRKRIPVMRDSWKETATETDTTGVGKSNTQLM